MPPLNSVSAEKLRKIRFVISDVKSVCLNKSARKPAYLIQYQSGESVLVSSAQLTCNHSIEELENKGLLTVVNFPRKQIGKVMSDCLTTGVWNGVSPESIVACGVASSSPGSSVNWFGEPYIGTEPIDRNLTWDDFTDVLIKVGTLKNVIGKDNGSWRVTVDIGGSEFVTSSIYVNCDPGIWMGSQCLVCVNFCEGPVVMTYDCKELVKPLKPCPDGLHLA